MAAVDPPPPRRRLLLATAHPDDESLFFVPALLRVGRGRGPLGGVVVVDVLCLSTGNAAGLGAVRIKEVAAALPALLGSRAGRVTVIDHPGLQDGMHTAWDVGAAADAIINALRAQPGTAVLLSFDRGGVTGHPNHAATAAAVGRVAAARPSLPVGAPPTGTRHLTVPLTASSPTANPSQARRTVAAVASWRLRSLPWYLAWLGPAALVVVPALVGRPRRSGREGKGGPITILSAPTGPAAVLRGLAAHSSQLTWWRVLGALARSASYVSVLEEIRG